MLIGVTSNGRHCVSCHRSLGSIYGCVGWKCLPLLITGPLWGKSQVTDGFPSQWTSKAESVAKLTLHLCASPTLQWRPKLARWRLKSPASGLFALSLIHTRIKENIKAPRHWPLWGEFTVTGGFSSQRAGDAEYVSIWSGRDRPQIDVDDDHADSDAGLNSIQHPAWLWALSEEFASRICTCR